jgi:hypothetical protein
LPPRVFVGQARAASTAAGNGPRSRRPQSRPCGRTPGFT